MKKVFLIAVLVTMLIIPLGCKAPAKFEVTSLDVTPPEVTVRVGETANIVAEVTNTGASEGTYTAVLIADGAEVERKDVTVAAGATETVTFSLVKDTPGTYQIAVGGLSSTLTVGATAKIEITFNPDPVPCAEVYSYSYFRVILAEVNGIGVKLNKLTMDIYQGKRLLDKRDYDISSIEKWLPSAYLPAHSSASFGACFACQEITHEIVTVTGIDDNGHEITATGSVDFLRQVELKYDDGRRDGDYAIGGPRGYLVQFSAPSKSFTINKVRMFGWLYGTGYEKRTFEIEIWDENLETIYSVSHPHTDFYPYPEWVDVEIPNIVVSGDFYIFLCTNTPAEGGIKICFDSSIKNEHSEVTMNWEKVDWYLKVPKEKVNWMIRVVGTVMVPAE